MIIAGEQIPILETYQPKTTPALSFEELANGFWACSDRGTFGDAYEAEIEFSARQGPLHDLLYALQTSRNACALTLEDGEDIFGPEVSATSCAVQEYGVLKRAGWQRYTYRLRLRAIDPVFTGVGSLDSLRLGRYYDHDRSWDIIRHWSLGGVLTTIDGGADAGLFTADFRQTRNEAIAIRRYILGTVRGSKFTLPTIAGIEFPFGPRAWVGPFQCRILGHELQKVSLKYWNLKITFAEDE